MTDWQQLGKKVLFDCTDRIPLTLVRGKGVRLWDDHDREYIDFVGGWAVCSLGHCHPVIQKALREQAKTLVQMSQIYYTIPNVKLSELLVRNSCMSRVFLCNSGLEANEGAVKLARRVPGSVGRRQFLTVKIEGDEAIPVFKESGAITSVAEADGYIEIPENIDLLEKGEVVTVTLF